MPFLIPASSQWFAVVDRPAGPPLMLPVAVWEESGDYIRGLVYAGGEFVYGHNVKGFRGYVGPGQDVGDLRLIDALPIR